MKRDLDARLERIQVYIFIAAFALAVYIGTA